MYLSNIELVGFKSFAQKTHLKFNEGITAIVGPNGCGKTNIVDAMRWVLGEQKSSTLRSDKMEDVIFNGTKARKALGMSEVSLTIQNSKNILPTEYNEVTITRRLFRNGESQYLLNRTVCRLRDIVNLFMDTGMGANAYSVIELKMIETILSDKMDERRRLFEEASGVTRYKSRRKETQRRLKAVQTDLERVQDILIEVRRKVNSLSRQADKAKKYKELTSVLIDKEKSILEFEYSTLLEQIEPLKVRIEDTGLKRTELESALIEQETVVSTMEEEQSKIEIRLSESEQKVRAINKKVAIASQDLAVSKERLNSITVQRDRSISEKEELESGIVELAENIKQSTNQLDVLKERIQQAEKEHAECKAIQDATLQDVQKIRGQARESKDAVLAKMNRINALQATSERSKARIESLRKRVEETTERIRHDEERVAALEKAYSLEVGRADSFTEPVEQAEQELQLAQEQQENLRADLDQLRQKQADLQTILSRKKASLEFLTGLVDNDESSSFLLKKKDWAQSAKAEVLAERIGVDKHLRLAVAAALGEAKRWLVVNTGDDARNAMSQLAESKKGKVTFVCLDRVPHVDSPKAISDAGVLGWASDLVRVDEELVHVSRLAMQDVAIAETDEAAIAFTQKHVQATAVTLEGTVYRAGGAVVRGGGTKKTDGAIVGKREQIEVLTKEVSEISTEIEALRSTITSQTQEYRRIDLRQFSDRIRKAEAEKSSHIQRLNQLTYQRENVEKNIEDSKEQVEKFHLEIQAVESQSHDTMPEVEKLRAEKDSAQEEFEAIERSLKTAESQFDVDSSKTHQAEMRLVQLRGELRTSQADISRLENQVKTTQMRLEQRGKEIHQAQEEEQTLQDHLVVLERDVEDHRKTARSAIDRRDEIANEQAQQRKRIHEQAEHLRKLRRDFESATQTLHSSQLNLSELETKANHTRQKALEDHELELSNVPVEYAEDFDLLATREEVQRLRNRIQSLGAVNQLAFEEYEQEKERFTFLETQFNDLQESEKSLTQAIREINATAQAKFKETFAKIRENFIKIFRTLFLEGDEADLLIEESDDPLEARIEIIAKPRGKRPSSIEMLSGGEKTLTAIALLFAIYLVKPSPFCILDEVDAPLDDANIDRYVKIIRQFSENTQFIMITHNKRTMEAADTMYGVSMEEEGVSKIVSVRFTENETAQAS